MFFVKALYFALEQGCDMPFHAKVIWSSWIPPKVSFFACEAT